jgi:excisionase family DNA binding protein
MPHHLQVLFGTADEEIAQNSYKPFRETRSQLIGRLLDPTLSLEETARILNVCPTTVRRYTNRGVLPHYRTAGNQRRFRLSDILSFMENGTRSMKPEQEEQTVN